MIISISQQSKLAELLDARFIDRMAQMLLDRQEPNQQQPIDHLRLDVKRMVQKAQQYGMNTERDAAGFVVTAFLLGEDFDRQFPAAGPVLQSNALSGEDKAAWLANWTTEMFQTLEEDKK